MKFTFADATPMTASRRLALAAAPDGAELLRIRERFQAVDGIKWLTIEPGSRVLVVGYDRALLGFGAVTDELEHIGVRLDRSGWNRLRSAWHRFVDENARADAHHSPGCCGEPPPGTPGRKH